MELDCDRGYRCSIGRRQAIEKGMVSMFSVCVDELVPC